MNGDEIKRPIKKWPLAEAHNSAYQMDQDRRFERMMSALEDQCECDCQQQLDIDPDVDAFIMGIVYSLQKSSGQQREHLFADIQNLIYDMLYPKRATAPCP